MPHPQRETTAFPIGLLHFVVTSCCTWTASRYVPPGCGTTGKYTTATCTIKGPWCSAPNIQHWLSGSQLVKKLPEITHSSTPYLGIRGGWQGTAVAQCLRHCATNQKVAGSIPDGVTEIFQWHHPSDRTMTLGSTQPLTEMSTRRIS